jgi:serralysin
LDIEGHAGTAAKVLGAVFGRSSVTNSEYAGIAISLLDGGMSYEQLMGLAINARLGASASHKEIVELLYINVAGVGPSAQERQHFEGLLGNGTFSVAALGVLAADTDLNQANIDLVGLAKSGLQFDLI